MAATTMAKSNPYHVEMPDGSCIERSYRKNEDGKAMPFGSWKWVVYDPDRTPKRKKPSLYTKDKSLAVEKAREYIKRRALGLFDPWEDATAQEGTTINDALKPYLKAKRRAGASDSTLRTDEARLKQFAAVLPAGASLGSVSRKALENWLNRPSSRGGGVRTNGSKNRDRATLLDFYGWCVEKGMTTTNPVSSVKGWKKESNRRDHATEEDVEAVLRVIVSSEVASGTCRQWLRDWIVFGFGSGLRPDEMRELRWSAVHLAARSVEVCKHHRGKTKKSRRTAAVRGAALAVLVRRQEERATEADGPVFTGATGGPVSVAYATKQLKAFATKAGLSKNLVSYGLRHGFGTRMTAASKPIVDVSRMMGTSVGMLEDHYAHYDPRRGAAHVEDVYGDADEDPKVRERFDLAVTLHQAGRLTLAEASQVAEMQPETFAVALAVQGAASVESSSG